MVDGDPAIRLLASSSLKRSGYSVITAENGKEALRIIEECQPHLMIADINIRMMDDCELISEVRQHPTFRLLLIVFLTPGAEPEERIRGYQ